MIGPSLPARLRYLIVLALLAPLTLKAARGDAEPPFLSEARQLIADRKLDKAESVLLAGIKANPDAVDAHYLLGYVYFREQRPKDSLAEYTLGAAGRHPTAGEFRIIAADYVFLKSLPDADRWFTEAAKEAPGDAEGWYLLGRTKYNEGKYAEAAEAFQRALAVRPQDVKAEDNLGLSYQALNRIPEAKAAFETAISWQQNLPNAGGAPYLDLGELLLEDNESDKAIANLRQAASLSPNNPKAHEELGRAYQQSGDLASARIELEKTIDLAPQSSSAHFQLGQIYRRLGQQDLARKELEISAHLTSTHSSTETPNFDSSRDGEEKLIAPPLPSANAAPN